MYIIEAPKEKFGELPAGSALITDEVKFTGNIAFCPKFYWKKHHVLQGCIDITPLWMKERRLERPLHRILIIATGGMGDSMWCMPFARYLREKHPRARILVATDEKNMPLWFGTPHADLCVKHEYWNMQALIRNSDDVFDFGGIATFLKKEMKLDPIEATFLHVGVPLPKEKETLIPKIVVSIDEGKQMEAKLKRDGVDVSKDKIIVIGLEASTSNRNWPFAYTKALTEKLIDEGYKVIWLSKSDIAGDTYFFTCQCGWEFIAKTKDPPAEISFVCPLCKAKTEKYKFENPPGLINWADKTSIREALAVIALADCYIGPNSSLMVIAAALRTPCIGLFGAFDPKIRAKFYERFEGLYQPTSCSPCNEHWTECREGHPAPCMRQITPLKVYDTIKKMIELYPRSIMERLPIE